jgi:hypothetical protein
MLLKKVREHLKINKISFIDHFVLAVWSGVLLIYAGMASIIHAFFPFLFDGTPARIVSKLYFKRIKDHPNPEYRDFK